MSSLSNLPSPLNLVPPACVHSCHCAAGCASRRTDRWCVSFSLVINHHVPSPHNSYAVLLPFCLSARPATRSCWVCSCAPSVGPLVKGPRFATCRRQQWGTGLQPQGGVRRHRLPVLEGGGRKHWCGNMSFMTAPPHYCTLAFATMSWSRSAGPMAFPCSMLKLSRLALSRSRVAHDAILSRLPCMPLPLPSLVDRHNHPGCASPPPGIYSSID